MKILMLAPEPFFQPRGTPISIYFRIKALSDLGHKVDLVTYHLGEDKRINGLKILRIPDLFSIKRIKIGPSFTKIPLDFLLLCKATWQMMKKRYDLIFSHEEAGWFGTALAKIWGIPHIYDMHSSLPQQLENFGFSRSKLIKRIFLRLERFVLKNSKAVIVICLDLEAKLKELGFEAKARLLENFIDFEYPEISEDEIRRKREEYAPGGVKIVLYVGNFQPYQGIPFLLEAAEKIRDGKVNFLLVGGDSADVEKMERIARYLNISDRVHFTGQVAHSKVPLFISLGDVLVSPRRSGTNTPLKIYSFLKSGKPVVATNLWTHTQVLNNKISVLVEPEVESLAKGIYFALFNEEAKERARAAREMADREFTYPRYKKIISDVLEKAYGGGRKS